MEGTDTSSRLRVPLVLQQEEIERESSELSRLSTDRVRLGETMPFAEISNTRDDRTIEQIPHPWAGRDNNNNRKHSTGIVKKYHRIDSEAEICQPRRSYSDKLNDEPYLRFHQRSRASAVVGLLISEIREEHKDEYCCSIEKIAASASSIVLPLFAGGNGVWSAVSWYITRYDTEAQSLSLEPLWTTCTSSNIACYYRRYYPSKQKVTSKSANTANNTTHHQFDVTPTVETTIDATVTQRDGEAAAAAVRTDSTIQLEPVSKNRWASISPDEANYSWACDLCNVHGMKASTYWLHCLSDEHTIAAVGRRRLRHDSGASSIDTTTSTSTIETDRCPLARKSVAKDHSQETPVESPSSFVPAGCDESHQECLPAPKDRNTAIASADPNNPVHHTTTVDSMTPQNVKNNEANIDSTTDRMDQNTSQLTHQDTFGPATDIMLDEDTDDDFADRQTVSTVTPNSDNRPDENDHSSPNKYSPSDSVHVEENSSNASDRAGNMVDNEPVESSSKETLEVSSIPLMTDPSDRKVDLPQLSTWSETKVFSLEEIKELVRFISRNKNDGNWSCSLCGITKLQTDNVKKHCLGREHCTAYDASRHLTELSACVTPNQDNAYWSCSLCGIVDLQAHSVQKHCMGRRHTALFKEKLVASTEQVVTKQGTKRSDESGCNDEMALHNRIVEAAFTDTRYSYITLTNTQWSCSVCQIRDLKRKDVEPHCLGKKHTAAVKAYEKLSPEEALAVAENSFMVYSKTPQRERRLSAELMELIIKQAEYGTEQLTSPSQNDTSINNYCSFEGATPDGGAILQFELWVGEVQRPDEIDPSHNEGHSLIELVGSSFFEELDTSLDDFTERLSDDLDKLSDLVLGDQPRRDVDNVTPTTKARQCVAALALLGYDTTFSRSPES